MKKITLFIILTLSFINSYSQEFYSLYSDTIIEEPCDMISEQKDSVVFDLPEFYVIENDTVGVIITVEQAQKIDSDLEMLKLFKQLDNQVKQVDEFYITVINSQNDKISILETTISKLKQASGNQDEMIKTLKDKINQRKRDIELANQQIFNDQVIIQGLKEDLSKEKTKKIIGTVTTGSGAAILLGLLIWQSVK